MPFSSVGVKWPSYTGTTLRRDDFKSAAARVKDALALRVLIANSTRNAVSCSGPGRPDED